MCTENEAQMLCGVHWCQTTSPNGSITVCSTEQSLSFGEGGLRLMLVGLWQKDLCGQRGLPSVSETYYVGFHCRNSKSSSCWWLSVWKGEKGYGMQNVLLTNLNTMTFSSSRAIAAWGSECESVPPGPPILPANLMPRKYWLLRSSFHCYLATVDRNRDPRCFMPTYQLFSGLLFLPFLYLWWLYEVGYRYRCSLVGGGHLCSMCKTLGSTSVTTRTKK